MKKCTNKILAVVLSVILVLSVLPVIPFTTSAETEGDYEYEIISNNTEVRIIKYVGSGGDVYIPNKLVNKPVTEIESNAFSNNNTVTYIWIGKNIRTIGENAFSGCSKLSNIDFGSGLQSIGSGAFNNCTDLKEVVFPDSLTFIGGSWNSSGGTFYNCTSLENIIVGNGLKVLPENVFNNCISLKTVTFGEALETIESYAFDNCYSIADVYYLGDYPEIQSKNDSILNAAHQYCSYDVIGFDQAEVSATWTVVFDANGGLLQTPETGIKADSYSVLSFGGKLSAAMNPEREGYTFAGWYDDASGAGDRIDFNSLNICTDTHLYAKWNVNTYRILFVPCGGQIAIGGKYVEYGDMVGDLPIPVLDGNSFEGWYLGINSSGPEYTKDSKMPAKNIVLYAGWKNMNSVFSVVFDTNGGSFINAQNIFPNQYAKEPQSPTRTGYKFAGWYKESECKNAFDFDTEPITSNITLFAFWYKNNDVLNCAHEQTEVINKSSPTCTEAGYTGDTYCKLCGKKLYDGEVILATGHKYVWKITKLATENENGLKEEICSVCGEKTGRTQEILYTGHITGDINGDGKVNNKDLTRLFQYLSDWDVDANEAALDINGDGKVNNKDLTRLFQFLSDWDVEIY